jgi:hypothetical protein
MAFWREVEPSFGAVNAKEQMKEATELIDEFDEGVDNCLGGVLKRSISAKRLKKRIKVSEEGVESMEKVVGREILKGYTEYYNERLLLL